MEQTSPCVRHLAQQALASQKAGQKVDLTLAISADATVIPDKSLIAQAGRPEQPELVHPRHVPTRNVNTEQGRGMLLHALAHIEFNAINLALDLVVRFAGMPAEFYRDWLKVAREEALHHQLLAGRLNDMGLHYGSYPAHDGLWQMAEKTKHSLVARLALVPRLLEARGLDVSPGIRDKLSAAGDEQSAEVLDIILRDEIGHVKIGNRWFAYLCDQEGQDPIAMFEQCLAQYQAPMPRSPFNFPAREQAGFTGDELDWLLQLELKQSS